VSNLDLALFAILAHEELVHHSLILIRQDAGRLLENFAFVDQRLAVCVLVNTWESPHDHGRPDNAIGCGRR
jgi:hypothetical protein